MVVASPQIMEYFKQIEKQVEDCYKVAKQARAKGLDPERDVAIPIAKNMAERVVGLISVVSPQIINTTVTQRITELEREYGQLDWRVGFKIAEEVAKEKFYQFSSKQEAIEVGIRVGFAYLTLGIVSAPLEGFIGLKIKKRRDGKEYFALQYAGPIRGAGGTAASTSVILSDYVRVKMGYFPYDPEEVEINRYTVEVHDYHERVTNLQYHPSDEELKFILSHLPVEVDGDPTEKIEVSNYKDLPRIETNLIRGGVALVLAEGLTQKAPKLWKKLSKWGKEMELEWDWLQEFIKIKERIHAAHTKQNQDNEEEVKLKPNNTYIMDLVAGRPILTHPLREGGFRLRYGRSRTSGFSATAVHPATLVVLNQYIAIGTQLKMERPGKAATVTLCDTLDGPIVLLESGEVVHLSTEQQAKHYSSTVKEILFLGDILFNYGDFSENGHRLVPSGYCPEWWALEVEKALESKPNSVPLVSERLKELISLPLFNFPTLNEAVLLSQKLKVPLHPEYVFYWKLLSIQQISYLISWLKESKIKIDDKGIQKIILPYYEKKELYERAKRALEELGVPHKVINKENVILERKEAQSISLSLNFYDQQELQSLEVQDQSNFKNGLDLINSICKIKIVDKAGTFIGSRMGRPEKAKMRQLTGSPQVMFPVGDEGDRLRSFQAAIETGKIHGTFPLFFCEDCKIDTIYHSCQRCFKPATKKFHCRFCGDLDSNRCRHGEGVCYKTFDLDIRKYFNEAQEYLKEKIVPDLIKGVRGTSNKEHIVEHLCKGILRAKHGIYVNKDGTTRYDCTELPITHFKPKEVKTSVTKLRECGYLKDMEGEDLTDENQILELKPQDVIVPGFESFESSGPKVLNRIANFVDDLLVKFYKQEPFYNIKKSEDLVGQLVIGLAPHISAGMIGRIIGFSETQGLITSPMYHAGMRRDCDGDEACVMLLLDALLNFSRQYLPERRGAKTMDAPLVLTSILDPAEVDDQVHGMDVVWKYPLEFYEAAVEMKNPWEVKWGAEKKKIEQLGDRLGTPLQYENFGFTHYVDNFNKGVQCSAYKTLPSMEEKLFGQMEIAQKIRAVDLDDVAKLVIQKHFLKDIKGNLRKFSMQQFRCVKCNEKYRRPPLTAICSKCSGKLIFTISEGSVVKYLDHSLKLAEKYDFSEYLKQTLKILQTNVDNIFGKEKEKQVGLGSFIC